MSVKNILASAFAVAAFGTVALAQQGAPPNGIPRDGDRDRMNGRGAGKMDGGRRGARDGFGAFGRGGMRGFGGIDFERLNLTDQQKQRIQTIQTNARNQSEANRAQFEEMANLMRLKREGLLTNEQGTRLTALQAQAQTQAQANRDRLQNEILAVLTADQRTILEQMRTNRANGRGTNGLPGQRRPSALSPNGAGAPPIQN